MNKRICFCLLFLILSFSLYSCTKNNELKINLYSFDELYESIAYKDGDNLNLPIIEKEGYEFIGWYLDKNGTNKFDETKIKDYLKDKELSIYALWKEKMNELNLEIKGLVENKIVNNPIITWENKYNDVSFNLKVFNKNSEVLNIDIENTIYRFKELNYSSEYRFIVTGNTSNKKSELSYRTISNLGYNSLRDIEIDPTFVSNMVLQRNELIEIDGVGPEMCLIETLFNNESYYSISDEYGNFKTVISEKEGSYEPVEIKIGNNFEPIILSNILIGDVYLFSGQSNMQWPIESSDYLQSDLVALRTDKVRFYSQGVKESTEPLLNTSYGKWFSLDKGNPSSFSAIAIMTASILYQDIKDQEVPIGILTAYQGNTNIANWMGSDYYQGKCSTKHLHYNAMIYPLRNHKINGVVWYHGCNNSAAGGEYQGLLSNLFKNYRDLFKNNDLNFFVIGLACYDGDSGNNYDFSYVRESQALACKADDNAYFISSCDNGDPTYIHPSTKRYICLRIAKSIENVLYGNDNYYAEGPSYKNHTVNGNIVTIELNNSEGLYSTGVINEMYLAGADGKYYLANAQISDNKLIVSSSNVSNPVYIKYGFGKSPFVNVFNKDDFSLVPFRTDNHNINIDLLEYNTNEDYYNHPDGSAMSTQIVTDGLKIKKYNNLSFGSIRLDKWGMVSYDASGFRFTLVGSNSNAKIQVRFIEGPSYETWAYEIIDDFSGEKTFEISLSDFKMILNRGDNLFDTQCISYLEIMIEANKEVNIEIKELKFVNIERTEPKNFTIASVTNNSSKLMIALNKSIFADEYEILISNNKNDFSSPIYSERSSITNLNVDLNLFTANTPYYLKATAINELGTTSASNNVYTFYINDGNSLNICMFDFTDQDSMISWMDSNMQVHNGLNPILQDQGVKIESNGSGWEYFIFVIESGSNKGMAKLVFDADFSNYSGSVVLEIVGTNWEIFEYTLDLTSKKKGTFEIPLILYTSKTTSLHYNNENLMWISFNFNDNIGNGYIIFDDCILKK